MITLLGMTFPIWAAPIYLMITGYLAAVTSNKSKQRCLKTKSNGGHGDCFHEFWWLMALVWPLSFFIWMGAGMGKGDLLPSAESKRVKELEAAKHRTAILEEEARQTAILEKNLREGVYGRD
jgi:hypothetical protein